MSFRVGRCNEPSGRISGYQYTFNDYHDWLEDQAEVEEELGVWDASTIAKFKVIYNSSIGLSSFLTMI